MVEMIVDLQVVTVALYEELQGVAIKTKEIAITQVQNTQNELERFR